MTRWLCGHARNGTASPWPVQRIVPGSAFGSASAADETGWVGRTASLRLILGSHDEAGMTGPSGCIETLPTVSGGTRVIAASKHHALVTAFVVAPVMTWAERGTLDGFWSGPRGPLQYVWGNWFVGVRQYGIHELFRNTTPWGRQTGSSVIDGPLWSLVYEIGCYAAAGMLAVTAVLRRARWIVAVAAAALYGFIIVDQVRSLRLDGPPALHHGSVHVPLLGEVFAQWTAYLGFVFLAGALLELYRERVPIHDGLGLACAAVLAGSLCIGGFFLIGLPALAYVLVWIAVRAPRPLRRIGRRTDLSYGIYIYGFVGQQTLASLGANRWGFLPYTALSIMVALTAAYLSWNVVERHALALKDWTPRRGNQRPSPAGTDQQASGPAA